MTVSLWQDRSSSDTVDVDLLVVGAGISGASAAYWLTREEQDSVAIVDAGVLGRGASGKSAGMLLLGTADPYSRVVALFGRERAKELWSFTRDCRALLCEHVLGDGALDTELRLVRTGTASAAASEHELTELEASHSMLVEDGFPHELLDRPQMKDALGNEAFFGGLRDPAGMTVDPLRLTERVLGLAVDGGARFFPSHEVFDFEHTADHVLVRTTQRRFRAQMVLICANGYAPLLDPHFSGRVYPTRGQMLATEPLPERIIPWGIYADFGYEYFWQLESGEVVAGGWRQNHEDAEKGYSDETTEELQEGLWEYMLGLFPRLSDVRVTHRWGGVMGFSGDGVPFIGELPGRPRIKYLGGHTGHGLGFGFLAAKKLVRMALEGDPVGWLVASRPTLSTG